MVTAKYLFPNLFGWDIKTWGNPQNRTCLITALCWQLPKTSIREVFRPKQKKDFTTPCLWLYPTPQPVPSNFLSFPNDGDTSTLSCNPLISSVVGQCGCYTNAPLKSTSFPLEKWQQIIEISVPYLQILFSIWFRACSGLCQGWTDMPVDSIACTLCQAMLNHSWWTVNKSNGEIKKIHWPINKGWQLELQTQGKKLHVQHLTHSYTCWFICFGCFTMHWHSTGHTVQRDF